MKLNQKLRKTLALGTLVTLGVGSVPVTLYASDYDNHWAKSAIVEWSDYEVLKGYEDGTFRPEGKMSRAEFATLLMRIFGLSQTDDAVNYSDVPAEVWYQEAVNCVSSAGLMNDYADGSFRPGQLITREEAAYALVQAYNMTQPHEVLPESKAFTDQNQVSKWAEESVQLLTQSGYIKGNPDGSFAPKGLLTRAEVLTILDRMTTQLYTQPGTYTQDVEGNIVINTPGVVLENMVITGNVYLAEGVGTGAITLNNVTVQGTVHIQSNTTLKTQNTHIHTLHIEDIDALELSGDTTIETVDIQSKTLLTLKDSVTIENLVIKETAEETIVKVAGTPSTIGNLQVYANNVKYSNTLIIDEVTIGTNVSQKPEEQGSTPSSSGSTGNSGSSTEQPSKPEVKIKTLTVHLEDGEKRVVPLNEHHLAVTIDQANQVLLIEDVIFDQTDTILGVTVESNIDQLLVGSWLMDFTAFAGIHLDKLAIDLPIATHYTSDDFAQDIADNQAVLRSYVGVLAELAQLEPQTEASLNQKIADVQQAIVDRGDAPITVSGILHGAETTLNDLQKTYNTLTTEQKAQVQQGLDSIEVLIDGFTFDLWDALATGDFEEVHIIIPQLNLYDGEGDYKTIDYTLSFTYLSQ